MKRSKGFTLIEMMIVVVIVVILAAVALPGYQDHVRKTRRTQAKADLMEIAQILEREFTVRRSYADFDISTFNQSPRTGTKYYDITLNPQTATTYTIVATPAGGQAADSKCLILTLNQLGAKTASGSLGTAGCW